MGLFAFETAQFWYTMYLFCQRNSISITKTVDLLQMCLLCYRHEITGLITEVGSNVKGFTIGDRVGVGCLAASCLECEFCKNHEENYCDKIQFTYNGIFWDGSITYGGYSEMLVADHRYISYKVTSLFYCSVFFDIPTH